MNFNLFKKDNETIYKRIKEGRIPREYKDIGKYMQLVFNHYEYSKYIVNDTQGFLSHFLENGFDFNLFTDKFIEFFDRMCNHDYIMTLGLIDRIYVSKSHEYFTRQLEYLRDHIYFASGNHVTICESFVLLLR